MSGEDDQGQEEDSMTEDNLEKLNVTQLRIKDAIELAVRYGGIDGDHHKAWVIDQMVRVLAGADYDRIVREAKAGDDGPDSYGWDTGIAP